MIISLQSKLILGFYFIFGFLSSLKRHFQDVNEADTVTEEKLKKKDPREILFSYMNNWGNFEKKYREK